jgi:hypothetical protein
MSDMAGKAARVAVEAAGDAEIQGGMAVAGVQAALAASAERS